MLFRRGSHLQKPSPGCHHLMLMHSGSGILRLQPSPHPSPSQMQTSPLLIETGQLPQAALILQGTLLTPLPTPPFFETLLVEPKS